MSAEQQSWQWDDLDPLTRTVVAGFSGFVGEPERGHMSNASFIEAMTTSFDMTADDVIRLANWGGAYGMRNVIATRLACLEAGTVTTLAQTLGRLAGGGVTATIAAQAGEQLNTGHPYDAIDNLHLLSLLAVWMRELNMPLEDSDR